MTLSVDTKDKLKEMGLKGHHIFISGDTVSFPIEILKYLSKGEIEEIKNQIQNTIGL